MNLDDFRKLRDEAHKAWNETRQHVEAAKAEIEWAFEQHRKANLRAIGAHEDYKRSKELFRIARDFNLTSLKDAEMILKLRDGGAQ
jgi:hypothetical protein